MATRDMTHVGLIIGKRSVYLWFDAWLAFERQTTQQEASYHGTRPVCFALGQRDYHDSCRVMLVLTHNGRDIVNGPLKFALQCGKG